jgi:hypothetical protein
MSLRTAIAAAAIAFAAIAPAAQASPFGDIGGLMNSYVVPPQPAPVAEVGAAAATKNFGGQTQQGAPIAFRVSGRRITQMGVQARATCDSGMSYPVATVLVRSGKTTLPLLQGGAVKKSGKFTAGGTGQADLGSQVAAVTIAVAGKLGAKRSAGAMAVEVNISDKASGQQVDRCTTAPNWSEKVAERRVFSGLSEQPNPIVLELTSNRKSVKAFWFGFVAACTPDGAIAPADVVTNFPIHNKRFGDDFSADGDDGSGGTLHIDYSLHGKISRASSSGTFEVTATDRDAAGNTISSCPSGPLRWSTRQ